MSETSTNQSGQIDIARLFQEHSPALVSYLRRQFGDGPPCPEDMAQQAFEKLLQRRQTEKIDNYPGFLRQTARNLTISALRRANVQSLHKPEVERRYLPQEGYESSPENVIEIRQQLAIINEVLREMPASLREAFVLNRIDGMSKTDIAKRQGVSRPAVVKRLAKASAQITAALAHRGRSQPIDARE
ncbi:MAG: sigma-70 family RNA polymerase sigma factor [Pseudomonadota bacterium]